MTVKIRLEQINNLLVLSGLATESIIRFMYKDKTITEVFRGAADTCSLQANTAEILRSDEETSTAFWVPNKREAAALFSSWREVILAFAASRSKAPEPVIESVPGAVITTEQVIVGSLNDAVQVAFMKVGDSVSMKVLNQNLPDGLLGKISSGHVQSCHHPAISVGTIYIRGTEKCGDSDIVSAKLIGTPLKTFVERIQDFNAEHSPKKFGITIDEPGRIRIEV